MERFSVGLVEMIMCFNCTEIETEINDPEWAFALIICTYGVVILMAFVLLVASNREAARAVFWITPNLRWIGNRLCTPY